MSDQSPPKRKLRRHASAPLPQVARSAQVTHRRAPCRSSGMRGSRRSGCRARREEARRQPTGAAGPAAQRHGTRDARAHSGRAAGAEGEAGRAAGNQAAQPRPASRRRRIGSKQHGSSRQQRARAPAHAAPGAGRQAGRGARVVLACVKCLQHFLLSSRSEQVPPAVALKCQAVDATSPLQADSAGRAASQALRRPACARLVCAKPGSAPQRELRASTERPRRRGMRHRWKSHALRGAAAGCQHQAQLQSQRLWALRAHVQHSRSDMRRR
jgi:hypothetical protein